nr:hypothetical protein CFP56_75297 [Quercus suber]
MPFSTVRYVRARHSPAGQSTIISDDALEQFHLLRPDGPAFSIMDVRSEVAVHDFHPTERASFTHSIPWSPSKGFGSYILDLPGGYPHFSMHRSLNVDYIFILPGEISLIFNTEQVVLRTGDCVQIPGSDHR